MLVSIVIPCYNSERTIGTVVDLCIAEFEKMESYDCEIILVNDYSRDGTFRVIQECVNKYPNVRGLNLAKNFGQHAAIMAGLHHVNGELVVGMDDDMQNHPDQIREFLSKQEEGYDVVFGVFEERKFSWFKNLTGAISRFLRWHLMERPENVQMSSFWLARRYVIEQVKKYEGEQIFIQLLFFRATHNMTNITISHYKREYGKSNYDLRKGLKLFLSFMNYTALPLRVATFFGILFSCTGFIGAIVLVIRKLQDPTITLGWSSIMCAMMICFGILHLMVGIMGEYVGKIILNVNKMPQFVVRDFLNIDETVCDEGLRYRTEEVAVCCENKAAAILQNPSVTEIK